MPCVQAFKDRAAQPGTFAAFFSVIQKITGQNVQNVVGHDWLTVMRAMAVQALRLGANKDCREVIQQGTSLVPNHPKHTNGFGYLSTNNNPRGTCRKGQCGPSAGRTAGAGEELRGNAEAQGKADQAEGEK